VVGQVWQVNFAKGSLWLERMVRLNQSLDSSKPNATAQSVLCALVKIPFGLIIIT
jgi:hypothetical protein